jgi:hypothetical protein
MNIQSYSVLSACFLTLAFASNVEARTRNSAKMDFASKVKALLSKTGPIKEKKGLSACSDLSGNWKGTCVDSDGDKYEEGIIVEQDKCTDINLGESHFNSGGAKTTGSADTEFMFNGTLFPDWNSAGTIFRIRQTYAGRSLGSDYATLSGEGNYEMQLINQQLVARSTSKMTYTVGGQQKVDTYWDECTYDKVPDSAP